MGFDALWLKYVLNVAFSGYYLSEVGFITGDNLVYSERLSQVVG